MSAHLCDFKLESNCWIQIIGTRAKPSSPIPRSRPRVRARVARLFLRALVVVRARVAPFSRARSAPSHTEGSKMTRTRNFLVRTKKRWYNTVYPYKIPGTLVLYQWYSGTKNSCTRRCRPSLTVRLSLHTLNRSACTSRSLTLRAAQHRCRRKRTRRN